MIGERIGTYRILRQLGEGGMGTVWLAEHVMIGRRAAIKMLHPHISSQPDLTQRFFHEAKAAAAVQDAGIVQIFDFGQHSDGRAYLVMELLEGESLETRMARTGPVPLAEALRILEQVASSIGAVHHRGIVHRDLKPDNIYLVRDVAVSGGERPKILDFGIAKIANAGMKTMTSLVMGTPMFMSPEQCRGAGNVDARSDVYSLGCMLFLMLTGRPPFFADGVGDLIAMHLREPAPAPSSLAPGIPAAVDALILRCLEKDPSRRFATASELAEALAALLAQLPGASQPLPAAHPRAPSLEATAPMPVLAMPMAQTTLTSTSGIRTAPPKRARPPLMGWLYVGIAAALISMSAVVITTLQDRAPAEVPVTNVTLPAASPEAQPKAVDVAPKSAPPSAAPTKDVAPTTDAAPAQELAPAPVAEVPPAPAVEQPTAPVAPAKPKAPRPPASDLGTIGGDDSATSCADQRAALDAFLKASYQQPVAAALKQARALPTSCFDKHQRFRFSLVAISLACKANDRASVQRFYDLAGDTSLRARCPKFLP